MNISERGSKMRVKCVPLLLGAVMPLAMQGVVWASGGEGHGGLNWTDFALRTVNFVILAGILFKLLNKPIANFFTSRRQDIEKLLAELEAKRLEAEKTSAEYKAKLGALEAETKKIVDELLVEGEAERQKIVQAAERQAEYVKQQAQLAIQQEIKAAREALQEEISDLSVAAAEEVLRKKMRAEDQERLVRDFMTKVVEAK